MSGILDCFKGLKWGSGQLPAPTAQPAPISASPGKVLMIDVSHYEPVPDYVKLKANGVGAVYAKASEHQPDSLFKAHIKAAQAAGLPCGGYHFMHAAGGMSGMAQADLYLSCVKDLKLELKHCLDWESGSADGMSSDHQQGVADGWLASVEKATGRVPCIYGGESFLNDLKLPIKYAKYPLWLAHYGCAESHLKIPFPWRAYAAWQYTDAEAIAGLSDGQHVDASHADLGALLD